MGYTKKQAVFSVVAGIIVFLSAGFCVFDYLALGGDGFMNVAGPMCFRFFTIDSNAFAALVSLPVIFYSLRFIRTGKRAPMWVTQAKFIAMTALGITFVTVIGFLGPLMGYGPWVTKLNFFLHILNPVLVVGSFFLWEVRDELSVPQVLWTFLPFGVYTVFYLVNVVFTLQWEDLYHFNMYGLWPVSLVVMTGLCYLLIRVLRWLYNRRAAALQGKIQNKE